MIMRSFSSKGITYRYNVGDIHTLKKKQASGAPGCATAISKTGDHLGPDTYRLNRCPGIHKVDDPLPHGQDGLAPLPQQDKPLQPVNKTWQPG